MSYLGNWLLKLSSWIFGHLVDGNVLHVNDGVTVVTSRRFTCSFVTFSLLRARKKDEETIRRNGRQ